MLAAKEFAGVGMVRLVVVPSPSCSELLRPQHDGTPLARNAQVCDPPSPAATANAKVRLLTVTSVGLAKVVPLPSWPEALSPQQRAPPSERTAQLYLRPPAGARAFVRFVTCTGAVRRVVVPSPIWPLTLVPQHCAVPSLRVTQLCDSPA